MWWKKFIQESTYNYGLDSSILINLKKVWVASGHMISFYDPLIDCKICKSRDRVDKLIEDAIKGEVTGDGMSNEELINMIHDLDIKCPNCGSTDFTDIRKFNLLFEIYQGVIEDTKNKDYYVVKLFKVYLLTFKM